MIWLILVCCLLAGCAGNLWYSIHNLRHSRRMQVELADLFADAERYRWLKARTLYPDRQEAEIDAAIAKENRL